MNSAAVHDSEWESIANPGMLTAVLSKIPKSDFADIFVESTSRTGVVVSNEKVTQASTLQMKGVGIRRINRDGDVDYQHVPTLDPDGVAKSVDDKPRNTNVPPNNHDFVQNLIRQNHEALKRWGLVENITLSVDRIQRMAAIADRMGNFQHWKDKRVEISAEVRYHGSSIGRSTLRMKGTDELGIQSVIGAAVLDAEARLDAVPIDRGEYDVILAAGGTGMFIHELVGHAMETDVHGTDIPNHLMPEYVTVIDRSPFGVPVSDDEGTIHNPVVLIDRGRPAAKMSDQLFAMANRRKPSGNGRRQDYRHLPMPRMWETYVVAGTEAPEDILKSVKRGVYVEAIESGHAYSDGDDILFKIIRGRVIEDGQLTRSVAPVWLGGCRDSLGKSIMALGADLQFDSSIAYCGKNGQWVPVRMGQPTLRLRNVRLGYV